ncbi:response regulator transcription factor [Natronospora cellulosivora (SeqCode)]
MGKPVFKILIAEDESRMRKVLREYLKKASFEVIEAEDGKTAIEKVNNENPDMLILDLMLPGLSGEEVCQRLRISSDIPILILTAKGRDDERINGFAIGADDYLVKPFNPRELVARVKAILRRSDYDGIKAEKIVLDQGKIVVYPDSMIVELEGEDATLTATEFSILDVFLRHPGQVLSRDQLADYSLGLEFQGFDRTIDTHVKNIRRKLNLRKDEYIKTIYGKGYKFIGDQNE